LTDYFSFETAMTTTTPLPKIPSDTQAKPKQSKKRVKSSPNRLLFYLLVLIPLLTSSIYYGLLASDLYVSESRFVIRSPQKSAPGSVVGALLSGSSLIRAQDDAHIVLDFISSRDALREMDEKFKFRTLYGNNSIDALSRHPLPWEDDSFELLHKHYLKHIVVEHNSATGITTLKVHAFNGLDAKRINEQILAISERLVNGLNNRARNDLLGYSLTEVADLQQKAKNASIAVASYRNRSAVFDPEKQSVVQLQLISKLQDELIASKLQYDQTVQIASSNPQIPVLQSRVLNLQKEIDLEKAKITGSASSLSSKSSDYERLILDRGFIEKQLASALVTLENAKNEANRKSLYLERIVQPHEPDSALQPKRLRAILTTLILGFLLWGVACLLAAGIREHRY
jgi:capsular polysaccharide transport system permease protein